MQKITATIFIVMVLATGIGIGYFFGYDHGWEKANASNAQDEENYHR